MKAEYVTNCSNDSALLRHYAEKECEWRKAGKEIKKAISQLEFTAYFLFSYSALCSPYFTVQRMWYQKELYAVVTNSAINYFFEITEYGK